MLMDSGAYRVQNAACAACGAPLGWKFVRAAEKTEKWKIEEKVFEMKDVLEATKNILHQTEEKLFVDKDAKGALKDLERLDGVKAHVKQVERLEERNESLADIVYLFFESATRFMQLMTPTRC